MKNYIYLSVLLFCCMFAHGQTISFNQTDEETIAVATNTNIVVTGERLYFSLFCSNADKKSFSEISKIAYIELISDKKKSLFKQKLILTNGAAQGSVFISGKFETGNYKLIAYTKWMLNFGEDNFATSKLTIINPFVDLDSNAIRKSSNSSGNVINVQSENLKTDQIRYKKRDKVNLKLAVKPGSYTLSVRKLDFNTFEEKSSALRTMQDNYKSNFTNRYQPEIRGEIISGKLTSKTVKNLANIAVTLTIPYKTPAFKLVTTNAKGGFMFALDSLPISDKITVQVFEKERDVFQISIDSLPTVNLKGLQFSDSLPIQSGMTKMIEERSVSNQIANAYYDSAKDSIIKITPSFPFYHTVEKEYLLDDFTRFPTVRETITEVLREVGYSKSSKGYSIFVRKYGTDIAVFGPPLVLIDGFPIQDLNELFELSANTILKVGIVNEPYIYGPKTFSGVLSFTTKNADFIPKKQDGGFTEFNYLRPTPIKEFETVDYSILGSKSRIPDYRYQLLWLPNVRIEMEEMNVSFFTSDVTGTFKISLNGISKDGTPMQSTGYFTVE